VRIIFVYYGHNRQVIAYKPAAVPHNQLNQINYMLRISKLRSSVGRELGSVYRQLVSKPISNKGHAVPVKNLAAHRRDNHSFGSENLAHRDLKLVGVGNLHI
jgi:hypothetical protein